MLKIGDRTISEDSPAFIIAEAGINHNGSLETAKRLVDVAVESRADCVKFQKRDIDSLYTKKILENPNIDSQGLYNLISVLKKVELSDNEYKELFDYCQKKGILFLCTPWDKKSVDFLESLGVQAYKISSADLTNIPLIKYISSKGKPMILSTGMSSNEEIKHTVSILKNIKTNFALMHCNSTYPSPYRDINLRFMQKLSGDYSVITGYSGHEKGISVTLAAVAMGAKIVERHFTIDKTMQGPDHSASLEPSELKELVSNIRIIESAMGHPHKKLSRGEILTREGLAKSIVSRAFIKKGEIIKENMLDVKGPGKGLSPQLLDKLINKPAKRDIKPDDLFLEEDI